MNRTHLIILVLTPISLVLAGCSESTLTPTADPLLNKIEIVTLTPSPIVSPLPTDTPTEKPSPTSTVPQTPPTKTPWPTPSNTPSPTPIPPYEILVELFEYDQEFPVDLVIEAEESREGVTVQTVKYYGAENPTYQKALRVSAYLVLPIGNGPFPAILYLHAGMMNKDQYLDEAILLAQQGVVCLVIDGPISSNRGKRLDPFNIPKLRDAYIRTVIDLRRGIDVLESLPQIDPDRMAYVGHSYGATWGGVLAGVETRLRAYVLMAGYAQVSENDTPQVPELDAIRYLGYAAPAAYLFQYAENDAFIDHEEAQLYFDTANEPKTMLWYDTDHFTLQHVSQADRLDWLGEQLDFTVQSQ